MRKRFASDAQMSGWGEAERLALFVETAERGSFSAAGRGRGMAASSVARQIDALERELGAILFRRSTRALNLTEAGEIVRERARQVLKLLADTRAAAGALQAEPRGRLRLAAPATFGQRHIVPLIAPLLKRYPRLEIELLLEDRFTDLFESNIDLAVRISELPDSTLIATTLAPQRRVACAAPAYLVAHGTPRQPADLAEHVCLTTPGAPLQGWWIFDNPNDRIRVRGRFICRSTEALLRAAIDGLGVAHLPTWLVADALRTKALVLLFPQKPVSAERPHIHIVRPAGPITPKVRATIDFLKGEIGTPPAWDAGF